MASDASKGRTASAGDKHASDTRSSPEARAPDGAGNTSNPPTVSPDDSTASVPSSAVRPHVPEESPEDMQRLRDLLLGDVAGKLKFANDMRDPEAFANHVAEVLPHAASIRAAQDGRLADAFAPTVEDALERSIRTNPKPLTDAIFPILGPAIRKAIAHSMQSLVQNVNQAIESTLTPRGIRMRMKAKRRGVSYAEFVLSESLVYRVEEVYLIHAETGLLLAHAAAPGVVNADTDLVSGMFTAIQDFVRDSFGGESDASLAQFRVGELTVIVERGPQAVIAAVVRGTPPGSVRTELQEAIEGIHSQSRATLQQFDGDATPFEPLRPTLQSCIAQEHRPPPEPTPARKILRRAIPVLLGLVLLTLLGLWAASAVRASALRTRVDNYAGALRAHPGIRVMAVSKDDVPHVALLHDPEAVDALAQLRTEHLREDDNVTHSVVAMELPHAPYVLARARRRLRAPATVELNLAAGVLTASGTASSSWIRRARARAELVSGVDRFLDQDVWPPALASIRPAALALGSVVMPFVYGDDLFGKPMDRRLAAISVPIATLNQALAAADGALVLHVSVSRVSDASENEVDPRRVEALLGRVAAALRRKNFAQLRFHPETRVATASISGALAQDAPSLKGSETLCHVVLRVHAVAPADATSELR